MMQGQINTLMLVLESKDKQISALSEKVGELTTEIKHLKDGFNFLSNETKEIKQSFATETSNANKKINFLEDKA